MPDVLVSIVATLPNANFLPLSFCPVEVYVLRATAQVPSAPRNGGAAPTVVTTQRVAVIQGRVTNAQGEFVMSDADRAPFQVGDDVRVQATLDDPAAVTVKRFTGAHTTFVLHLRMQNPALPNFFDNLIYASRANDSRLLPLAVDRDVDLARSSLPNAARGRNAANVFSVIARMSRWFASQGTASPALGHVNVHTPDPRVNESFYEWASHRIVIDRTGAVPSVIAHEYGHHIFKTGQPGYTPPGGNHEWFHRTGGRSNEEQRKIDFSEAYATFCALNFLNESVYREVDTGWNWTTQLDAETMHGAAVPASGGGRWGDGPTAGYLYDLTDTDEPFFSSLASDARLEYREEADRFSKPFREIHDHVIRWGASLGHTGRTVDRFHRYLKETAYPGEARALDVLWTRNLPGADIPGVPAIPGWVQPSAAAHAAHPAHGH